MKARVLVVACFLTFLVGCSEGMPYGDVLGHVTLDGQPVQQGSVRFVPLDGKTPTAGAVINNGEFTARVPVNRCKVEISAAGSPASTRKPAANSLIDGVDASATFDSGELLPELIPARYNTQSELTLDVKAGSNEEHFDLKTKAK